MTSIRTLEGRTAVVSGASRGIGRAIAALFADEGANVVLVSRTAEAMADVFDGISRKGGRAIVVAADVTADESAQRIIDRAVAEFGGVDILVNNAGGNSFMSPLATMRFSGWQKTMVLNVDATVRLIQAALPPMIAGGHGSIVNVSSVTGLRGSPLMAHYGAAKAAVISLSQSLGIELGSQGVRVNALVPGWIETDLTGFLRTDDALEDTVIGRVPMGRWGRPEEIAQAALFLAGDASSFMTAQTLVIDGGLSANP